MKTIDIIIFICDKDDIHINIKMLEYYDYIYDKNIISCINKEDLLTEGEKNSILKKYKHENINLEKYPLLLLSPKESTGIDSLKNLISSYANNIISKKLKKIKLEDNNSSIRRASKNLKLKKERKKDSRCC